ncbi:MAG: hypothetical protein LIO44_04105 [Eubacterium sp.]|nr:hypothetical protein [Eubacterium sp.]
MKKIYEKPTVYKTVINTEEITAAALLSSTYTIHAVEEIKKSWTTISY